MYLNIQEEYSQHESVAAESSSIPWSLSTKKHRTLLLDICCWLLDSIFFLFLLRYSACFCWLNLQHKKKKGFLSTLPPSSDIIGRKKTRRGLNLKEMEDTFMLAATRSFSSSSSTAVNRPVVKRRAKLSSWPAVDKKKSSRVVVVLLS